MSSAIHYESDVKLEEFCKKVSCEHWVMLKNKEEQFCKKCKAYQFNKYLREEGEPLQRKLVKEHVFPLFNR